MNEPEKIGKLPPADLQPEFESLRVECLELIKKMPLSVPDSARATVILHRMNEIIGSQPSVRQPAQQCEEMLKQLREEMDAD
jgi:hypothetical protein